MVFGSVMIKIKGQTGSCFSQMRNQDSGNKGEIVTSKILEFFKYLKKYRVFEMLKS